MPKIYVMCGIPGSGKSYEAKRIAAENDAVIISSDDIREEIYGDASIQGKPCKVFNRFYKYARREFDAGRNLVLDATNIKRKERKKVFRTFGEETDKIYAVVMDTPLEVCLERNRKRDRHVPEDVIYTMHRLFKWPHYEDGFEDIITVKYEEKER